MEKKEFFMSRSSWIRLILPILFSG